MKENFKKFLNEYVKNKNYNFNAYVEDLTSQWSNTGILEYELSSAESKDGIPHLFRYTEKDLKDLGYIEEE